jgi:uncharacterized phosphosugar-binding protein
MTPFSGRHLDPHEVATFETTPWYQTPTARPDSLKDTGPTFVDKWSRPPIACRGESVRVTTGISPAEAIRQAFALQLDRLDLGQVAPAAEALAGRLDDERLLFVLGCGHSQVLAFEGYYRAGSPGWVAPLLDDRISPARGANNTDAERQQGTGSEIARTLDPDRTAGLLIISTGGRNAVPVEAATAAREAGILTIGLTSAATTPLAEVVDHALISSVPRGDAVVEIGGARMAPMSTVAGAVLLHALFAETEARLGTSSVLVSASLEGADESNAAILRRYPHLRP